MHLEAEVYGLVLGGFVIVVVCTLLVLIYLFWRSRNQAILWFGGQTLFFIRRFLVLFFGPSVFGMILNFPCTPKCSRFILPVPACFGP